MRGKDCGRRTLSFEVFVLVQFFDELFVFLARIEFGNIFVTKLTLRECNPWQPEMATRVATQLFVITLCVGVNSVPLQEASPIDASRVVRALNADLLAANVTWVAGKLFIPPARCCAGMCRWPACNTYPFPQAKIFFLAEATMAWYSHEPDASWAQSLFPRTPGPCRSDRGQGKWEKFLTPGTQSQNLHTALLWRMCGTRAPGEREKKKYVTSTGGRSPTNKIQPVRRLVSFSPTCSLLLPWQASPTGKSEATRPIPWYQDRAGGERERERTICVELLP